MVTSNKNLEATNLLDQVRINDGIEELSKVFKKMVMCDIKYAMDLINAEGLQFTSLFVLRDDIKKLYIFDRLNKRNQMALDMVNTMLANDKKDEFACYCSWIHDAQMVIFVLRWMMETGSSDDGFSEEYTKVMDSTAAILTTVFADKASLQHTVDLIFQRWEKGRFIDYLVWAFFQAREPYSLVMIAEYLKSTKIKEKELACRLLAFAQSVQISDEIDGEEQYMIFQEWLEENNLYLYFQDESFQESSHPVPYVVIWKAKYMGKTVSVDSGEIIGSLTEEEELILEEFESLDEETKISLAEYSSLMRIK
ncbi:hypothetical protein [Clostridium sp. ZS2-4]|uniref:hypothetical protein n=1 Tax=Clostridium sp. ZS2-4 TaxID=2987703 RepID=UPI00227C6278|nr:hypothetical protein [Clostridium sp. ZS2-4]MCY6355226.1 hypothetical protein [Clostridium sp. ZS2-4]